MVVNDLGGAADGAGSDRTAAEQVVDEITAMGAEAVANADDVADWDGGEALINSAIDAFGRLDILINNAGILRDRVLINMSEDEWDSVVKVHMKGHFIPTRWAARYWREQMKAGEEVRASVVHTSSTSGLLGNAGQTNYGAAKAGIASFSIICAQELKRYGVRSNCISPAARTRLTEATPGLGEIVKPPDDAEAFDVWDPANVSPLVAYLATADCPFNGATFYAQGGTVRLMEPWRMGDGVEQADRWTVEGLKEALGKLAPL
ncbi:MAG: hypothetical protein QOC92_589 [Acidimicrobiaceae bacterium]